MPFLPVVFGLGEVEAAAAIGISASKFRTLVNDIVSAIGFAFADLTTQS